MDHPAPPLPVFTPAERRLIRRLRTPTLVQRFLNRLPYNTEPGRETLRSLRQVSRHRSAHCLEAALVAACDHVIFVYRKRGRWGSVARSRDPGLHGRKPVFRSVRALAMSYFDPYIDFTGCLTGYAVFDLRRLRGCDWRLARRNVWAVERALVRYRHKPIKVERERVRRYRARYRAYRAKYSKKPLFYRGREKWTPIPKEFL